MVDYILIPSICQIFLTVAIGKMEGKSLSGPQSTGLPPGRKDLIKACAANGIPFATVGRPMKISREEIIALTVRS